jgi:hypothetical protein
LLLRSGYPEENIRYHFYIDFETNVRPKDRTYTVKSKDYQKYPYEWFHKAILKNLKKAFTMLDKDNTGSISYDIKKLSECNIILN